MLTRSRRRIKKEPVDDFESETTQVDNNLSIKFEEVKQEIKDEPDSELERKKFNSPTTSVHVDDTLFMKFEEVEGVVKDEPGSDSPAAKRSKLDPSRASVNVDDNLSIKFEDVKLEIKEEASLKRQSSSSSLNAELFEPGNRAAKKSRLEQTAAPAPFLPIFQHFSAPSSKLLFRYLDDDSIAQSRLVCKSWKTGLQRHWLLRELEKYKAEPLCFLGDRKANGADEGNCIIFHWSWFWFVFKSYANKDELSALRNLLKFYHKENVYDLFKGEKHGLFYPSDRNDDQIFFNFFRKPFFQKTSKKYLIFTKDMLKELNHFTKYLTSTSISIYYCGKPPLLALCRSNSLDTVKTLVESGKVDLHETDENGRGIVHNAFFGGSLEIVQYILRVADEYGLDVNARDSTKNQYTPLHLSCFNGIGFVTHFLDMNRESHETRKIDMSLTDAHGRTFMDILACKLQGLGRMMQLDPKGRNFLNSLKPNWREFILNKGKPPCCPVHDPPF